MSLKQQLTFWLLALLVFVLLLWLLSDILLPFVAGAALAYLQSPLVDWLERHGFSRTLGSLLIICIAVLGMVVLVLLFLPILIDQVLGFISKIPAYYQRLQELLSKLPVLQHFAEQDDAKKTVQNLVAQSGAMATTLLASLWAGGKSVVTFASLVVVMPVVTFYLLVDWHRMVGALEGWFPLEHRDTVHGLIMEIDRVITAFVRGQLAVCFILGSFYAVSLWLVGLNFGWVIGLTAGLLTFIPYVGSLTGLVLAVSMAVAQFWPDPTWMVVVLGICVVGQFLEGSVLVPNLVGRHVGLHPVWLILSMFAFGYLFGLVGFIVAVPLAAIIGVLFRFALRQYLASPIYTGSRSG
jgi:predicted PurR-regulated permease PerM